MQRYGAVYAISASSGTHPKSRSPIESLQAVVLVSHRRKQVTVYQRSDGGWEQRDVRGGEIVVLSSPELSISVDELYAGIEL